MPGGRPVAAGALISLATGLNRLDETAWPTLSLAMIQAAAIAAVQAVGGVVLAETLGESPWLGLMTSDVSLMGGFGAAAGFAPEFENAGLAGAAGIGVAAVATDVIAGGLIAGVEGGALIDRRLHRMGSMIVADCFATCR